MVRKSDKHRELNEEAIESVYLRGSIDHHLVGMRRERGGGGAGGCRVVRERGLSQESNAG